MEKGVARKTSERVHPGWHALGGVLVIAWLGVMWFMFGGRTSALGAVRLSPLALGGRLADFDVRMGAYYKGRKLGSLHAGLSGRHFEQNSRLAFEVGGSRQRIESRLAVELDGRGSFSRFKFAIDTAFVSLEINGRQESPRPGSHYLSVSIRFGTERIKKRIKLTEAPIVDFTLPRLLATQDLSPGRRYSVAVFDPRTLNNRRTMIEVLGMEAKKTGNGLQPAIHLRRQVGGVNLDMWIDKRGNLLAEQTELGLDLRLEGPGHGQTNALPVFEHAPDLSKLLQLPGLALPHSGPGGSRP